jgi:hypothetical protein
MTDKFVVVDRFYQTLRMMPVCLETAEGVVEFANSSHDAEEKPHQFMALITPSELEEYKKLKALFARKAGEGFAIVDSSDKDEVQQVSYYLDCARSLVSQGEELRPVTLFFNEES